MTNCSVCKRETDSSYRRGRLALCRDCYENLLRHEAVNRRDLEENKSRFNLDAGDADNEHDQFYAEYGQFEILEETRPQRRRKS